MRRFRGASLVLAAGLSMLLICEGAAAQALEAPEAEQALETPEAEQTPEAPETEQWTIPAPATSAPTAAASNGKKLVKQRAKLSTKNRVSGMPATSNPGQQLSSATVNVEILGSGTSTRYYPVADVVLSDYPTPEELEIEFGSGHRKGSVCEVAAWPGSTYTWSGTRSYNITGGYNPDYFPTPKTPWNCTVVKLSKRSDGTLLDAFVGEFENTYHSPKLSVSEVRFLGKKVTRLSLVRSSSTRIQVKVRNTGKAAAQNVTLSGTGSSLKFGKVKVGTIASGDTRSVTATVKLTGKRKSSKLTIRAKGTGVSAKKTIAVRAAAKPAKPREGKYKSSDGAVTFRVDKGKITGFHARVQTRCGIAPDPYRYSTVTYDFPKKKIPRNGIVDSRAKGGNWSTSLRVRISGSKATAGYFSYSGPGACSATKSFTAKRSG